MAEDEQHISKERARAGTTPKMTRVILVVSLLLVVIAYVVIVLLGSDAAH